MQLSDFGMKIETMVPFYRNHDRIPEFIDPLGLPPEYPLVAIGGAISVENLKLAYENGIFPFPQDDAMPTPWVSLDPRGVLFTDKVHKPKSLLRQIRKSGWRFSINQAFPEVIAHCATLRPSTWITPEMMVGYTEFFHAGYVLSFEIWNAEKLVGGLYGVFVKGIFSGESMFHIESGASKAAILFAARFLRHSGVPIMDTQMLTAPVELMGGEELSRADYYACTKKLQKELRLNLPGDRFDFDELRKRYGD